MVNQGKYRINRSVGIGRKNAANQVKNDKFAQAEAATSKKAWNGANVGEKAVMGASRFRTPLAVAGATTGGAYAYNKKGNDNLRKSFVDYELIDKKFGVTNPFGTKNTLRHPMAALSATGKTRQAQLADKMNKRPAGKRLVNAGNRIRHEGSHLTDPQLSMGKLANVLGH